jgi:xanthine dehydrogenase accessory factor
MTATEISSALKRSIDRGVPVCVVSLMEIGGEAPRQTARLLVSYDGESIGGSLGNESLDRIASRHAVRLMADERQEIAVAGLADLTASFGNETGNETGEELSAGRIGDARLLFEISRPPLELIVCGGGHVGQSVARAGAFLNYRVIVIDDRAEFSSREKFPDPNVRLITGDFTDALRSLQITPSTHIVIVTRGHRHDEICLREVIEKPARYIGMIGSRRRTTTIREHLRRQGVSADLIRRVHAPIGLDIGALTPEEIALAIMSEIVLARRGGSGRPKSYEGPMARAR